MAAETHLHSSNGDQEHGHLIRVLLADDHALVREGTRHLLETEDDVEVVAEAASGEEAVDAAKRLRPDIAIMDIAMPGMGGIEATHAIKVSCPKTAVLVLSAYDDEPYLIALQKKGYRYFVDLGNIAFSFFCASSAELVPTETVVTALSEQATFHDSASQETIPTAPLAQARPDEETATRSGQLDQIATPSSPFLHPHHHHPDGIFSLGSAKDACIAGRSQLLVLEPSVRKPSR